MNNSSTIRDLAGNNATLTHSAVDNNSSYKVDNTLPTVSSVAFSSELTEGRQNNLLNAGDNVSVTVTFSEACASLTNQAAIRTLTLAVGSDNQTAMYASGDNSTDAGVPGTRSWQEIMTPTASASGLMPLP